jgi:hypothetical protein
MPQRKIKYRVGPRSSEMFDTRLFDGKNNEFLDSIAFRVGVHTVAFWGWVIVSIVLLSLQ